MPNSAMRPGSDEEWAELLRQLQHQPRATPRPFFYARVHARLGARYSPAAWLPGWVRRPAYAVVLGLLVLVVSRDGAASPPPMAANQRASYPAAPQLPR